MSYNLENTIKNLKKNNFDVYYFENRESLNNKLLDDIKDAKSISRGGSITIETLGIIDRIIERGLPFTDYKTPEDRKKSILAEYYLTSSNAITQDGKLVNVDGAGNRIAAMAYGPRRVLVVAGVNKIVKNVEEGFARIRNIAAPKNSKRLEKNTPCNISGSCSDCDSSDRICRKSSVIIKPVPGRFTIYLINEQLGY